MASETTAEAKMTIVIKHLRKVSKWSRAFWGSLAVSAELKANIALISRDNNFFNFSIDVNSRPGFLDLDSMFGGGTTGDLLERTSKKIAEEILL